MCVCVCVCVKYSDSKETICTYGRKHLRNFDPIFLLLCQHRIVLSTQKTSSIVPKKQKKRINLKLLNTKKKKNKQSGVA